jgi:tRNA modification GTPase
MAAAVLRTPAPVADLRPGREYVAWVTDPATGREVDQAVFVLRRAPRSYTGEDMAEIHIHGGRAVASRVLGLLTDCGARPARGGEFTMRAFLNGRMDLARAEAVAEIVAADSSSQLQCASRVLSGELSSRLETLYAALLDLSSAIEAQIEFPEDGIPETHPDDLARSLGGILFDIAALAATFREGKMIAEGARVVIAGRPNAGKSSLFNALCGAERAIVTEIPGTTRDPIEAVADWDGLPVRLFDTAGLRRSGDRIEMLGLERAERHLEDADAVIYVVDGSEPASPEDHENLARLGVEVDSPGGPPVRPEAVSRHDPSHLAKRLSAEPLRDTAEGRAGGPPDTPTRVPVVVAVNKSDLPPATGDWQLATGNSRPSAHDSALRTCLLRCSAKTGDGVPGVRQAVMDLLAADSATAGDALVITNARHYALLREAEAALRLALDSLRSGATEDLIAGDVTVALRSIGQITGKDVGADVLSEIFSKFCVGK